MEDVEFYEEHEYIQNRRDQLLNPQNSSISFILRRGKSRERILNDTTILPTYYIYFEL